MQAANPHSPAECLQQLESAARATSQFSGLSADRGRRLFSGSHGNPWRCTTCHTDSPTAAGRHTQTGRQIAPLAPWANPQRFTDESKAEMWFRRNCRDVPGRECTAIEKGDVLAWLMSIR